MAVDLLLENDAFVVQLRSALSDGAAGLSDVPALLKCVIREDRWRSRKIKTGETVPFDRFEAFVSAKPLEGLGADMGLIKRICSTDKEALDLIDRATQREPSKHVDALDNIQGKPDLAPTGTSPQAALRRLRKECEKDDARPEVKAAYASVLAGEISPHKAMVNLGYRLPTVSVPLDPVRAARILSRHFGPEQTRDLIRELSATNAPDGGSSPCP